MASVRVFVRAGGSSAQEGRRGGSSISKFRVSVGPGEGPGEVRLGPGVLDGDGRKGRRRRPIDVPQLS